jgi:hypothetical protein
MDLSWLKSNEKIIDKIAVKTGVESKEVINVIDSYFRGLKHFLTLKTAPTVRTKFFNFKPSKKFLVNGLKEYFKFGTIDREEAVRRVRRFWRVIDRLKQEKKEKYTNAKWARLERKAVKSTSEQDLEDIVQATFYKKKK